MVSWSESGTAEWNCNVVSPVGPSFVCSSKSFSHVRSLLLTKQFVKVKGFIIRSYRSLKQKYLVNWPLTCPIDNRLNSMNPNLKISIKKNESFFTDTWMRPWWWLRLTTEMILQSWGVIIGLHDWQWPALAGWGREGGRRSSLWTSSTKTLQNPPLSELS